MTRSFYIKREIAGIEIVDYISSCSQGEFFQYQANGKYYYSDKYEIHNKYVNVHTGASQSSMVSGVGEHRFESEYNLETIQGKFMRWLSAEEKDFSVKQEPPREGGGIRFTSQDGRGGAPISKYVDGQSENIDLLISTLSISEATLGRGNSSTLEEELLYIKDAINMVADIQGAGDSPFIIDIKDMKEKAAPLPPNTTKCLTCKDGYHGLPAVRTDKKGNVKDTIKPNPKTGKPDTTANKNYNKS